MGSTSGILTGIVVHWGSPDELRELLEAWPDDPRTPLLVVDNGGPDPAEAAVDVAWPPLPAHGRRLRPGRNLGFGGGVNAGASESRTPWLLILNPDAVPEPGALERLIEGFERYGDAAGLAPRLVGPDGRGQWSWQLRPLPSPWRLLAHALFVATGEGPREEPPEGALVEQPAAAALAIRRDVFEELGGFDARFYPAWFEDVDLARRLRAAGHRFRYHPAATFRHGLGGSVPGLGYGRFLWIYGKNLHRYLGKHHGRAWAAAVRLLQPAAALARLLALPLRKPRRARSRRRAALGLLGVAVGAWSGWRLPTAWARRFRETS